MSEEKKEELSNEVNDTTNDVMDTEEKHEGDLAVEEDVVEETVEEPTGDTILGDNTETQSETEKDKETKSSKSKEKKPLKKRIISALLEISLYVVIAVVCIFVVPKYVVQRTEVSGPSMENTLHNKDNILVEKISYRFGDPKRFDIIVFYHFDDPEIRDKEDASCYDFYVKRIIGLPGETVQIVDDTIYINGEPLEEHYGKDPITESGIADEPFTLDEDEYFVLGDNRKVSQDSRYEAVGNIAREDIVGKAWFRMYPFSKFGFLND